MAIAICECRYMRASTIDREAGGRRLKHIACGPIDMCTFDRLSDVVADSLRKRGELVRERRKLCGRTQRGRDGYRSDQAMLWFVTRPLPDKVVDGL